MPLDVASRKKRLAVVLFNLGGPDRPEAIKPFLARLIARARVKPATENYALLGGKSPLLELTQAQANALEGEFGEYEARCFIAMRYWHPFSLQTAREVLEFAPDEIVLLPLYPQ